MAKKILIANWKNYPGSLAEAQTLVKELAKSNSLYKKLLFSIAAPLVYLPLITEKARKFSVVGVQNLSLLEKGTRTGSLTPEILKSFGVKLVILGHSERRAMGESSPEVSEKVKIALKAGFTPVVCFGELVRDTEGEYFEFLREELKHSLAGLAKADLKKIILAYEPIWAIGKSAKESIKIEDLEETLIFTKKILTLIFGRNSADEVKILYGGSVEPANAPELSQVKGVSGFLVGHSSLKAKNLEAIAKSLINK